jgi:class 3 adenylate cyclase
LCSFSTYVRDTHDGELIRNTLTSFYSKARYEVLNHGGMIYQFVGDEIIGIFGLPDAESKYVEHALDCARALVDIGNSVSHRWQLSLDRVQNSGGVHIGIALGDLNLLPLRPFSRRHF